MNEIVDTVPEFVASAASCRRSNRTRCPCSASWLRSTSRRCAARRTCRRRRRPGRRPASSTRRCAVPFRPRACPRRPARARLPRPAWTARRSGRAAGYSTLGDLARSLTSSVMVNGFLPFALASIECLPGSTGTGVLSAAASRRLPSSWMSVPRSLRVTIVRRMRRGSSFSARSRAIFSRSLRFMRCASATASWKRAHALASCPPRS